MFKIDIGKFPIDHKELNISGVGIIDFPDTTKEAPVMGLPPMGYGIDGSNAGNDSSSLLNNAARSAVASSVSTIKDSSGNLVTTYNSVDATSFATGFAINTALGMDSYQQVLQSFPILEIIPIDVSYDPRKTGVGPNTKQSAISYKFAVDPQNLTISYNHSNTYQESNVENNMKTLMQQDTSNALRQLQGSMGNMFGSDAQDVLDVLKMGLEDSPVNKLNQQIQNALQKKDKDGNSALSDVHQKALNTAKTAMESFINTKAKGAKIDFPNIWTDSQTQSTQNFTIHLRTLSTSPESKQYWREIILPLYCLLTVALPPGGAGNTYLNPPYITCNLDNGFYEILLGGITNITVDFPASELNFLKVPRHITVTLSITDMYNVMPQDLHGQTNANPDLTTKNVLMKRFTNMSKGKSVYNADLYSREYKWTDWGGSTTSLSTVIAGSSALTDAVNVNFSASSNGVLGMTSFFEANTNNNDSSNSSSSDTGSGEEGTSSQGTQDSGENSGGESTPGDRDQSFSLRPYAETLDADKQTPILDSISNHLSIHFSNGASKGNIIIEGAGIEIGTLKRVKNVTSTTASANVAVRDLVSGKSPLELSKGYSMSLQLNGETPEISQSFLNSVTSKVCTSLKNLFT